MLRLRKWTCAAAAVLCAAALGFAEPPQTRGAESESSFACRQGLIPPESGVVRGQSPDGAPAPAAQNQDARLQRLSDVVGLTRLEEALANVYVTMPDGSVERTGVGVAIHYNSEFKEVLLAVSSRLFEGIDMDASDPLVSVEVFSPIESKAEEVDGQCVYYDAQNGLAFVAARVTLAPRPVAFLPNQAPMEVGERVQEVTRVGEEIRSVTHEVLAVDERRFYQRKDSPENGSALYARLAAKPLAPGSGCFVVRNGRLYFAGSCATSSKFPGETTVVPTSAICQALLSNRSLAAVHSDQTAGKFDVPATQTEIDYALDRIDRPNVPRKAYAFTRPPHVDAPAEPAANTSETEFAGDLSRLDGVDKYAGLTLGKKTAAPEEAPEQELVSTSAKPAETDEDAAISAAESYLERTAKATAAASDAGSQLAQTQVPRPSADAPAAANGNIYLEITPDGATRVVSNPQAVYNAVQPTSYAANPALLAAYEKEEAEFNAALDALRRFALEGAEIVCVVTPAPDPNSPTPRESQIVRIPKRTVVVDPAALPQSSRIELAKIPAPGAPNAAAQNPYAPGPRYINVPMTSSRPGGGTVK